MSDVATDAAGEVVATSRLPRQYPPPRRAWSVIIHVEHADTEPHGYGAVVPRLGGLTVAALVLATLEGAVVVDPDDSDPSADDAHLLRAVADGSREALAVLYRRHAPWLVLRLQRRCADHGVVDEVLQDTFVAAWRGARRWSGDGEVAAWLWGIAVRRLVDAIRRAPRPVVLLGDLAGELPGRQGFVESAEDCVLLGVEHGELAGALGRLSPELRAVVQSTVLDGLTTREAARLLGIPAGTVKTRMMRARAALREELA